MTFVMQAITLAFPNIPIIPVIGNNDVMYHNQAPTAVDAPTYYSQMWDIYVTGIAANIALFESDPNISTTFHQGGWYYIPLADNVIILCLNGMYPFYSNSADPTTAQTMIDWVEQMFINNPNSKFIMQTHVWPGTNYFNYLEVFWVQPYLDNFLTIMVTYKS